MDNKRMLRYFFVMILTVGLFGFTQVSQVQAKGAGFTVSAELPDNQYDDSLSSFDLLMKPGQQQTLKVTIENLENTNQKIKASANTGYTSQSGFESFNKHHLGDLTTAAYRFDQIFDGSQMIDLKPHQAKTVTFQVTMPDKAYQGILEGALYFKNTKADSVQQTNQAGFNIKNYYAIAIGVILREHANTHVQPDLKLRQIRVSEHNDVHEPAVLAKLENTQPATTGRMTINAQVARKKDLKTLFGYKSGNHSMATKSHFEYAIPLGNRWINPGKYHLHLVAQSKQQTWTFERDFEISTGQALQMNRKNKQVWWIWLIILLLILFIIVLVTTYYLGYRRRKKQDEKQLNNQNPRQ
ncbi:DUF916 and DUF3324 domain-containing protein [Latilactobacillus curvatus]|uniref:DUF916 and DUF3324 domain-containing protein n=1 Tax=Latilactobacillus curvatus TaxID=28038 RepID=UPI00241192E3|nr:DUF916 and DUF3324 domain-containing protein [Latilactobacillus curvatus]MDG2980128.1 DUF916 and DUF3324 domain-containing protein [Latilactobacillus curvatus]